MGPERDDIGRSLVSKKPDETRPGNVATPGPFTIDAVFDLPLPRPQRIADFRADVVVRVPRTIERLTVTDFGAAPVECVLAGVKLRIGPAYLKDGRATVDLAIEKAAVNQNQNRRPAWIDRFDTVRVEVGGRAMGLVRDGNDTKGPWQTFTLRVAALDGSTPHYGPITTLPTTLTWDIPGAAEPVRVPIAAHNLMVP